MKALYPDSMECVEVSEEVKKMIQPLPQILEKASAALEEIKSVFNLEEVEQKAYRRDAAQFFDRSLYFLSVKKPSDLLNWLTGPKQSVVTNLDARGLVVIADNGALLLYSILHFVGSIDLIFEIHSTIQPENAVFFSKN